MINEIIKRALHNMVITIVMFVMLILGGIYVILFQTSVDALPDLSENQVIVMTTWPGQSPMNIENQVTYPLTVGLQGLSGVRDIRAMSQLGLSMITIIFDDSVDKYFARDRVVERLSTLGGDLPPGVQPTLGPDATGLGQIFMYTLESNSHSLTELRSIQDFYVKLVLQSVPGVAEIASIGGYRQTYQVNLDKVKLENYNITISQVLNILSMSNTDVSGRVLNVGNSEIAIQGYGFYQGLSDIKNLVIDYRDDGVAIKIEDIAEVVIGGGFRRGILANQFEEKVGGIVVMRYDENPLQVTKDIKIALEEVKKSLPEGVSIDIFYDRTNLIVDSIKTLVEVLYLEIIIVAIILFMFLMHYGASLITVIALLVGVIMTFVVMYFFSISSNIMSLGGIAIAIGTMVDSAIVVTENIFKRLIGKENISFSQRLHLISGAVVEVGRPIVFAILIIILSFTPIFALQGMEGKLFAPLAFTNMFAMFGALLSSLFLIPVLCLFFLKGKLKTDNELFVVKITKKIYQPVLEFSLKFRKTVLLSSAIVFVIATILFLSIDNEFMPPLDEGSIMYMPVTLPDVSEKRALELLLESNRIISSIPEVEKVVGKAGRAVTATDPAPLSMIETIITLKPKSEWRVGISKNDIINEMNRQIKINNLWNGFTQPIIGRIDMLSTGIRTQIGVKVFGDDADLVENIAIKVEELMNQLPGGLGVAAIRTSGLKYLEIDIDDSKLALYGIQKSDVLQTISVGLGGQIATTTVDGRQRHNVEVRLKNVYRDSIDKIKSLQINSPSSQVFLDDVADIRLVEGPAVINTENGMIRGVVQMNVQGMGLVEYVNKGKEHLEANLDLPEGYFVEWSGQYENQQRAKKTLTVVVPLVIFIILFILYITYRDFGLVSIVALAIPFSLVGGFIALYFSGFNVSVAVWVGFIALFGNAVETGVVMMLYLENAFRERYGLPIGEELEHKHFEGIKINKEGIHQAVINGAFVRLRPILMTALTSIVGLMPMLTTSGTGAELQKPLAIVVVGGLLTSVALTLILLPVLFAYLKEKYISG